MKKGSLIFKDPLSSVFTSLYLNLTNNQNINFALVSATNARGACKTKPTRK